MEAVHFNNNTKPGPGRSPMRPDQWAHKTKLKYAKQMKKDFDKKMEKLGLEDHIENLF